MERTEHARFVETVARDWLASGNIALMCGDWRSGAIMELLPDAEVLLTEERYPEPFSGLRDVRLSGQRHHLHLDLAKIRQVVYAVVPSVCYGYRPSFEAQFLSAPDAPPAFSVTVRDPYRGARINRRALIRYFRRMFDHLGRFPEIVRFKVEAPPAATAADTWADVRACLDAAGGEGPVALAVARSLEQLLTPSEPTHA